MFVWYVLHWCEAMVVANFYWNGQTSHATDQLLNHGYMDGMHLIVRYVACKCSISTLETSCNPGVYFHIVDHCSAHSSMPFY